MVLIICLIFFITEIVYIYVIFKTSVANGDTEYPSVPVLLVIRDYVS
jgi:hypothetical protein